MMKNQSIYRFYHRASMITLAMFMLCMGKTALGQEGLVAPVADVFKVMELASDRKLDALWPEFRVSEIPVLVFDSLNTYLFHSRSTDEGSVRSGKDPEVWIYEGQHPLVRGNSIVRQYPLPCENEILSHYLDLLCGMEKSRDQIVPGCYSRVPCRMTR